jgi:hypothetical protein
MSRRQLGKRNVNVECDSLFVEQEQVFWTDETAAIDTFFTSDE